MVLARRRAEEREWERTSWLCAAVVNSNPFRDGPPVTPDECNPMKAESQGPAATSGIDCTDADAIAAYHDALVLREERMLQYG